MKQNPSDAAFPVTRWSIVARLDRGDQSRDVALEELCGAYRAPLYAYARRSGRSVADSEDLVQGFLSKALEDDLFAKAEEDKGKLRTFLLTTFRRYENDQKRREFAQKRSGGKIVSMEAAGLEEWYVSEGAAAHSPETIYDRRWAVTLLANSVATLALDWDKKGRGADFQHLRPYLTGGSDAAAYSKLGIKLGITPENVKVRVHRLRAQFGMVLRDEVTKTLFEQEDVEEELRYLVSLL